MLLLPFIPIMALVVQNALTVRAFNIVLKNLKDSISNLKKLKMHFFFLCGVGVGYSIIQMTDAINAQKEATVIEHQV